jgi:hypothetical protein
LNRLGHGSVDAIVGASVHPLMTRNCARQREALVFERR